MKDRVKRACTLRVSSQLTYASNAISAAYNLNHAVKIFEKMQFVLNVKCKLNNYSTKIRQTHTNLDFYFHYESNIATIV